MKTHNNPDQQTKGLPVQSSKFVPEPKASETNNTQTKPVAPSIDFAKRRANRQLATRELLALLRTEAPRFYDIAQVVGKWVWIQFTDKQPPQVTAILAEFGFHWNNKRQVWQHPCGHETTEASPEDPRAKYATYYAADTQPA